MAAKTMTIRLDEARAELLEAIAEANGTSQNEIMLAAIDAVADKYRKDEAFKQRVANAIERRQKVLDLLS